MIKAPTKDHPKHVEPVKHVEHVEPAKHVEPAHVRHAEKPVEHAAHAKPAEPAHAEPAHAKPAEPVAHVKPAEKTVKLKVQRGTDEINHEGVSYKVAQGPATEEWTVEVPSHVAEHIIRQGGAVQLDVSPPDLGEGFVSVRHVSDPKAGFSHGAKSYEPGKDGKIKVPVSIIAEIEPHGFIPC